MRQCEVYLHGIKAGMLTEEDMENIHLSMILLIWRKGIVHRSA